TALLAAHQHQALHLAARCALLDRLDDLAKLLGRAATERIHALALAVDNRPGDALEIDGEAPVLQFGKSRRHNSPTRRQYALGGTTRLAPVHPPAPWYGQARRRQSRRPR